MNSEKKDVFAFVGQLSQVLKQAIGGYNHKLSSGRTFEEHYATYGFYRFTKTDKKGKTVKKDYTPGTFKAAVAADLKEGDDAIKVFRDCPVLCQMDENAGQKYMRVYDEENAKKLIAGDKEARPLSVYKRVTVVPTNWSWRTIEKVLNQSQSIEKHLEKEEESMNTYEEVEKLYIIERVKIADESGKSVWDYTMKEVDKTRCVF